jgi:predicted nucleic acid-binding protein
MNMDYGCLSDPKSKDKYKGKVTEYTPNGKKSPVHYDVHCAYTYFTIPHETINTTVEETAWLTSMSEKILTEVRTIMCTEAFKTVLEKTGNAQFVKKLYDPAKKTNLPKFLDTAIITVEECNHYTDHVIQACANDIVTIMYDTRLSNRKYPDEILDDEFAGLEDEEVLQADLEEEKEE